MQSHYEADTLVVAVGHSGGCETHSYSLCYQPAFGESDPVQADLVLIHDANGDACEAYLTTELRFDMSPLAAAHQDTYPGAAGLIRTNLGGLYAYGDLSCEDRASAAGNQFAFAAAELPLACNTSEDCMWVSSSTACTASCGVLAGAGEGEILDAARIAINTHTCDATCPEPLIPPCVPPPPLDCVNGVCQAAEF